MDAPMWFYGVMVTAFVVSTLMDMGLRRRHDREVKELRARIDACENLLIGSSASGANASGEPENRDGLPQVACDSRNGVLDRVRRVRVVVLVDSDGRWQSYGRSDDGGGEMEDLRLLKRVAVGWDSSTAFHVVWLNADLPLPEPLPDVELEATVEKDEEA